MYALIYYVQYVHTQKKFMYVGAFVLGTLSMLAKPMAMSLPLVFLLCDWYLRRPLNKKALLDKVPFFVMVVCITLVTFLAYARVPTENGWEGVLIWIWTSTFHILKFFSLKNYLPHYLLPEPVTLTNISYVFALVTFCFVWGTVLLTLRKFKIVAFAILFYALSIFPLVKSDTKDIILVSDHAMYLPSLGICLALGIGLAQLIAAGRQKNKVVGGFLSVPVIGFVAFLSVMTLNQSRIWKDSFTLWNYLIEKSPNNAMGYSSRANVYYKQGRYDLAFKDYNQAITLDPNQFEAYNNRGLLYKKQGNIEQALSDYNESIRRGSEYYHAYNNRGYLLRELKRYDEAIQDFNRAVEINPRFYQAWNNRGNVYLAQGKYDLALADYSKAIAVNPYYAKAYLNQGIVYQITNNLDLALESFTLAIKSDEGLAKAYHQRSLLYVQLNQFGLALNDVDKAIRLDYRVDQRYYEYLKAKSLQNP